MACPSLGRSEESIFYTSGQTSCGRGSRKQRRRRYGCHANCKWRGSTTIDTTGKRAHCVPSGRGSELFGFSVTAVTKSFTPAI
ncbi:hypothetical protein CSUI_007372 [Cystoisospora suis]|uniref:Uncharacterized protein n=1 Tax=Cystoisospora suis TaxID=483139 RepID=A0A2C6KMP4_9APIC|nr:hypothetical protein CSUI_007372 [Cystoisospora suis]